MTSKFVPDRPPFSALPLDKSGPPNNAWGLYGDSDVLGALNALTPAVVSAAAAENIKTGERVSLDWPLNKPSYPSFDRPPFKQTIRSRKDAEGIERTVNDDHLDFNTQCGSQWDGFRHYGYQKAKRFYNNRSQDQLEESTILGIDSWVANGGIVGRGVLLDYAAFAARHSIAVDPFASAAIPFAHLEQLVAEQGVTFRAGDILFLRAGFTEAYDALSAAQQKAMPERATPDFLGVEPSTATLRWLWESGFAAVASDTPSFEQAPVAGAHTAVGGVWKGESWEDELQGGGLLHQTLLGGWGMPIGEMFDLDGLAAKCKELGRWTFFVTSVPLKVPGGVASPPNAIAIF